MPRSRLRGEKRKRYYLKLTHLLSPDDLEDFQIEGSDKVKALTRESQEDKGVFEAKKRYSSRH